MIRTVIFEFHLSNLFINSTCFFRYCNSFRGCYYTCCRCCFDFRPNDMFVSLNLVRDVEFFQETFQHCIVCDIKIGSARIFFKDRWDDGEKSGTYRSQTYRNAYPLRQRNRLRFPLASLIRNQVLFKDHERIELFTYWFNMYCVNRWSCDDLVSREPRRRVEFPSRSKYQIGRSRGRGISKCHKRRFRSYTHGCWFIGECRRYSNIGLSTNHNTTSPGSKRLISTFLSFEMFIVTDLCRNVCVYDCSIDLF